MSQGSAGSAPQLYEQDGEQQSHSVESNRLVSEDHSHYILIKGEGSSDYILLQFFSILLKKNCNFSDVFWLRIIVLLYVLDFIVLW